MTTRREAHPIRLLERAQPSERVPARRCGQPGCQRATQKSKPFCVDHVGLNPYASQVRARMEGSAEELERVARLGDRAVDPHGVRARDILGQLRWHGDRTVRRLARDLVVDEPILISYAQALQRHGLIRIGRTPRGRLLLSVRAQRTSAGSAKRGGPQPALRAAAPAVRPISSPRASPPTSLRRR